MTDRFRTDLEGRSKTIDEQSGKAIAGKRSDGWGDPPSGDA
jgi:hypothetical protein